MSHQSGASMSRRRQCSTRPKSEQYMMRKPLLDHFYSPQTMPCAVLFNDAKTMTPSFSL
jgi:hypothetical protein